MCPVRPWEEREGFLREMIVTENLPLGFRLQRIEMETLELFPGAGRAAEREGESRGEEERAPEGGTTTEYEDVSDASSDGSGSVEYVVLDESEEDQESSGGSSPDAHGEGSYASDYGSSEDGPEIEETERGTVSSGSESNEFFIEAPTVVDPSGFGYPPYVGNYWVPVPMPGFPMPNGCESNEFVPFAGSPFMDQGLPLPQPIIIEATTVVDPSGFGYPPYIGNYWVPVPIPTFPLPIGNGNNSSEFAAVVASRPLLDQRLARPILTESATVVDLCGTEYAYVSNYWDPTFPLPNCKPPPNLEYYVPPTVEDCDFFGGQIHMWHTKLVYHFSKYFPQEWKLQAVPDFPHGVLKEWMTFFVTSKLRFCCRACSTPWTSKQGKLIFAFTFDDYHQRGVILMKIYGQVCMKSGPKRCSDYSFQTPACYPEEIDRAMLKLSEFIGHVYFRIEVPPSSFLECRKSIRQANPNMQRNFQPTENHHRRDLCQACSEGLCKVLEQANSGNKSQMKKRL